MASVLRLLPLLLAVAFALSLLSCFTASAELIRSKPLLPPLHPRIPACSTTPTGWLGRQLRLQALGLSGSMHLFYPEVSDSEWIGTNRSNTRIDFIAWPYWLNGVVPLAFQTKNATLIAAVTAGIDYILDTQSADGLYGPAINDSDPWPRPLLLYAMQQYVECNPAYTERVVQSMYRYYAFLLQQLHASPPLIDSFPWTWVRISDMQYCVQWLYDTHPINDTTQQMLLSVNEELYRQAWDWKEVSTDSCTRACCAASRSLLITSLCGVATRSTTAISSRKAMSGQATGLTCRTVSALTAASRTHCQPAAADVCALPAARCRQVNNAMALKSAAVWWRHSGDADDIAQSHERLDTIWRYHGQASGMFSCDECFAGLHPSRGTELCAVVDAMWSLTTAFSILGGGRFADLAERIALNALPASHHSGPVAAPVPAAGQRGQLHAAQDLALEQ